MYEKKLAKHVEVCAVALVEILYMTKSAYSPGSKLYPV